MIHLRELLIIQCLHELADLSHHHHYHGYRTRLLRKDGRRESFMKCDEEYDERMDQLQKNNEQTMGQREEEMRQQFVELVQTTEDDLKRREREVYKTINFFYPWMGGKMKLLIWDVIVLVYTKYNSFKKSVRR